MGRDHDLHPRISALVADSLDPGVLAGLRVVANRLARIAKEVSVGIEVCRSLAMSTTCLATLEHSQEDLSLAWACSVEIWTVPGSIPLSGLGLESLHEAKPLSLALASELTRRVFQRTSPLALDKSALDPSALPV